MLSIMRSEIPKDASPELIQARQELQFEAAKAAAPMCISPSQHDAAGDPDKPIKVDAMSELETVRRLAFLMTKMLLDELLAS